MFKPLLFTTALAAVLSSALQPIALAGEHADTYPGPHILYPLPSHAPVGRVRGGDVLSRRLHGAMVAQPDTASGRYVFDARRRRFGAGLAGGPQGPSVDAPLIDRYGEPTLHAGRVDRQESGAEGPMHRRFPHSHLGTASFARLGDHRRFSGDAYAGSVRGGPWMAGAGGGSAYDFEGNAIEHTTEIADGAAFAPVAGDSGYGIPPAGGLAVYSPGAYWPGPRIISIRQRHHDGFASSGSFHRHGHRFGYGIPPAGGLAVYSPGAYGPGPRIISLRHHRTQPIHGDYGYGYDAGVDGYGIAPAGGLAVYSPGAFGPGPRIVTLSSGWGTASQQWGCGCGSHAED